MNSIPVQRVSELDRIIREGRVEWAAALPIVYAVLALSSLDMVMGLLGAWYAKQFSSQKLREGVVQKAALLLLLAALAVMDPFVALPLTFGFGFFFALSQIISLVENAGRLGIEIPKELFDKLVKLRGEKAPIKKKKPPDPK